MTDRQKAYETYRAKVEADNKRLGTHFTAHPYENFQWKECAICNQEIRDDPYGHNPDPVKEDGVCCSNCNRLVIYTRMRGVLGDEKAWVIANGWE
jgi:hypothetical protein